MTLRIVLLTTAALALAAACTPAAEDPAPETPAAADIAEPSTASGPAAENTTDSLATAPADAPAPADTAAAPATPATPAATGPSAEVMATGRAAYAQTCAMCHGPAGGGTQMGVALTAGLDAAAVKEKVVKGKIAATDTMPPMGAAYSEEQLDALAAFVEAGLPQ